MNEARPGQGTPEDIDNWFTYHAPTPDQIPLYGAIREKARELALLVVDRVPPSADRTAALRSLRETVMAINLAVACNPHKAGA